VLDEWFAKDVVPRLRGRAHLVRYADDFVLLFGREDDARRIYEVLPKRFAKYGLSLHPEKTRLIRFRRPDLSPAGQGPESFDLLGFTHHWGLTRTGKWTVKRRTSKSRFSRGLRRIAEWCRSRRHDPIRQQQRALSQKLHGHYSYFGITPNYEAVRRFHWEVIGIWRKWLSRRSQRGRIPWPEMQTMLERFPLPRPRIVHRYIAW